ncbi:hypothetical protein TNCV_736651 [Trichonephila clavipes]|nr:hypothetical protein TNCV_736651 [Trichonephila clavipes]
MSKSKELSELDRGNIAGCHFCGKSVREMRTFYRNLNPLRRTVRRELKNLEFRDRAATHKPNITQQMRSIDCNGVERTVIGLRTCGKLFFGAMNLVLQSGSLWVWRNVSLATALCPLLSWVVAFLVV